MNIDRLNSYLWLYTDVQIEKHWSQFKMSKEIILNKTDTSIWLCVYALAVQDICAKMIFNPVSIEYFSDMITAMFKEIAKKEWIDPNQFRWTADLFKLNPEFQIFYNLVWALRSHPEWTIQHIPKKYINEVISYIINKYVLKIWQGKVTKTRVASASSLDGVI